MCAQRRCPAVSCPHPALDGCACGVCDGCSFYGRSCFNGEQFPNPVDRCQLCSCLVLSHSCFNCRLTLRWFVLNYIYSKAHKSLDLGCYTVQNSKLLCTDTVRLSLWEAEQEFPHICLLAHADTLQIQRLSRWFAFPTRSLTVPRMCPIILASTPTPRSSGIPSSPHFCFYKYQPSSPLVVFIPWLKYNLLLNCEQICNNV